MLRSQGHTSPLYLSMEHSEPSFSPHSFGVVWLTTVGVRHRTWRAVLFYLETGYEPSSAQPRLHISLTRVSCFKLHFLRTPRSSFVQVPDTASLAKWSDYAHRNREAISIIESDVPYESSLKSLYVLADSKGSIMSN